MGEVYLAHDDKLDRSVAIKFLIGNSDERARKRLLTEARAVAALDHPNICSIHEIDADQWLGDFIVMQYVEGETLSVRLQRGRMLPAEALGTCGRIADALRAAHARGIIHRDLKPQNVILTTSGDPKLLDFGLAKNISSSAKAAVAPTETQLTKPHAVLGTAGYMSPEQVRSHPADHRSDLFALGCLLYECLTGKRAFTGGTSADIHADVLHREPPPPSTLVPELDASHDALVARLLEKDPEQRFQSAEEALGAMRLLDPRRSKTDGGSHVGPVPPPPRPSRARTIAIASAIAAVVVAIVLWQGPWFKRLPEAPPEAVGWYNKGVDAIREGRFWTARTSLEEAVRKFDGYALAYFRLAEACSELDDAFSANKALVTASSLIRSIGLRREEKLRITAIESGVLRKHDSAIAAYRELAGMYERDAAAWLDLGRAQEAAGRRADAIVSYRKALSIDSQYAAAHLRLAVLLAQTGEPVVALKEFDESVRLYHAAGQPDGESEALARKGQALITMGRYSEARDTLQQGQRLTGAGDSFHRIRISFDVARLTGIQGNYVLAESASRSTVDEATREGLYGTASIGLIDLAYTLSLRQQYAQADALLTRAIELAVQHSAKRAEMRARLQRASLLETQGKFQAAIVAAEEPLRYFTDHNYPRVVADGKNILARAYDGLEDYAASAKLSAEIVTIAQSLDDNALVAASLESVAGRLTNQGQLPEALANRERLEAINREQKNDINLPFDLTNRAELLIRLGRGADAEVALAEVARKAAEGIDSFKDRRRRVAALRAMRASIERRWRDVEPFAKVAMDLEDGKAPDASWRWGAVLLEHSRANQGTSRLPAAALTKWMDESSSKALRREVAFWVAQTFVARREFDEARRLADSLLAEPGIQGNGELQWRLRALAAFAAPGQPGADHASMRAAALQEIQALKAAWSAHADGYFARPDLAPLRQRLQ
jgi:tetratricopeptide (TPR) repeat protein